MNFLTKHVIGSYEELMEQCDAVATTSVHTMKSPRNTELQIVNLTLLGKQTDIYCKLEPVYDQYKVSIEKEQFLPGFENKIILFEAIARKIKKARLTKLPSSEKLKPELDGLSALKTALQAELRKIYSRKKEG